MNRAVFAALGVAVGVAVWLASRRQDSGSGVSDIEQKFNEGLSYVGDSVGGLGLKLDRAFDSVRWGNLGRVPDEYRFDRNVMALMRVIRSRESSQDPVAYYMVCGKVGMAFSSFADHPRPKLKAPCSRGAAGAYQITVETWDQVKAATPLITDFSPVNQERAALQLIGYRGALNNAIRGELRDALSKLKKEWTSLPGGAEQLQDYAKARAVFLQYGGTLAPGH